MKQKKAFAHEGNKGLTVKINLWSLEKHLGDQWLNSNRARLLIRGTATLIKAGKRPDRKFNDAGELISILGKWNAQKFRELKNDAKAKA